MTPPSNDIWLLFNEYGMASTGEIAKAVGCGREVVVAVVGNEQARNRDRAVAAKRTRTDPYIISCMVRRLGRRAA